MAGLAEYEARGDGVPRNRPVGVADEDFGYILKRGVKFRVISVELDVLPEFLEDASVARVKGKVEDG